MLGSIQTVLILRVDYYYTYSQRRTWLVGTLSWELFLTWIRMPLLSVTFPCLYYLWNFIPFISKWEGKMGMTSGNRWRHTKQYYGNSKLKHLLLVFLGNQEATAGKKPVRYFFLGLHFYIRCQASPYSYSFSFSPSFSLLLLKQSLHWNQD